MASDGFEKVLCCISCNCCCCLRLLGWTIAFEVLPWCAAQRCSCLCAVGVDYLYSAPYAGIYRGMGIVAANGVNTLPHNCLLIACLMGLGAVIMNLIRVRHCPALLLRDIM